MDNIKYTDIDSFICDKSSTCCFTGHRSKDLPDGGNIHGTSMKRLISMLNLHIQEAYDDGYRTFISGMAQGTDLLCARIVHGLKATSRFSDIKLVCALPYEQQVNEMKTVFDKYNYTMLLDCCDEAVVISERDNKARYRLRNQFMVDHSSRLIGVMKQKVKGSGTSQTVNMAKKTGLELRIIDLDNYKLLYLE